MKSSRHPRKPVPEAREARQAVAGILRDRPPDMKLKPIKRENGKPACPKQGSYDIGLEEQSMRAAKKAGKRATSRPRLTVDISPSLKRRIKVAAAGQDMSVSAYIARVLEQAVPAADAVAKASDGTISQEMIRRAAALRAEQKAPFPVDSADLVREARAQRHAEL